MSVKDQIDWSECPIGRKCEMVTKVLESEIDSAKSRHTLILKKLDTLHTQTSKLSGKLTIISAIFMVVAAALTSFIFDMVKDVLHAYAGQ